MSAELAPLQEAASLGDTFWGMKSVRLQRVQAEGRHGVGLGQRVGQLVGWSGCDPATPVVRSFN
jgi:hypothetical protein